jgi:hypothetical protein
MVLLPLSLPVSAPDPTSGGVALPNEHEELVIEPFTRCRRAAQRIGCHRKAFFPHKR